MKKTRTKGRKGSAAAILKGILACAARGCRIVPLIGKKPAIKDWPTRATTDPETITRWAKSYQNFGTATGKASGVIVLDVDPRHGGDKTLLALEAEHGELPKTVIVVTGSDGRHYYFGCPDVPIGNSTNKLGPGLDIRGEGGQVVAPPSIHPETGRAYTWDPAHHPDKVSLAPMPLWMLMKLTATNDESPFKSPTTIGAGERNTTLYRTGRSLRAKGLSDTAIREALRAENREKCHPPLPESEIHAIVQSVLTQADAVGFTAMSQVQACTDAGNARRFAEQHRDTVQWCELWKVWLVYDGRRWSRDDKGTVMQRAKKTARSIADEAQTLPPEKDDQRRTLVKWSLASEHVARLKAMLELAKSEEGLTVAPEDLDCDPWLLNVENGTIDLRTGVLQPHDRTQRLTKLAPIQYDPAATCTTWLAFLHRIMANDPELIDFLQRAFGYSLTASVRDRVLFLLHGTGANGKSTLTRILLSVLGDYALQTPSETLLATRHDGGIRNDLARLAGARAVAAMESDGGRRLASAVVKHLTGNDKVPARFLFSEYFEFVPTFKIWFSTNHRPSVSDNGDAIWDRLKLIPFDVRIPEDERDTELLSKLTAELPGILAWAVEGCLKWQRDGLGHPKKVVAATQEYRDSEGTFDQFLLEWCVCDDPKARVSFAELRAAYVKWSEDAADYAMSSKAMAAALLERGFKSTRVKYARFYEGLALRPGLLAVSTKY